MSASEIPFNNRPVSEKTYYLIRQYFNICVCYIPINLAFIGDDFINLLRRLSLFTKVKTNTSSDECRRVDGLSC